MIFHLGGNHYVDDSHLIALLPLDQPLERDTEALLAELAEHGRVRKLDDQPKTLVLVRTGENGDGSVMALYSHIGMRSLLRRLREGVDALTRHPNPDVLSADPVRTGLPTS